MRLFNTEGPVRPNDHYAIPPLERMDGDERPAPIRAKRHFVLHRPRTLGARPANWPAVIPCARLQCRAYIGSLDRPAEQTEFA